MAWNKPDDGAASTKPPKGAAAALARRPGLRGIVAALVVLVGAVAMWHFCMTRTPTASSPAERTKGPIKEVRPSAMPATVVVSDHRVISPEEQRKLRPGDPGFDPAAHPTVLVLSTNTIDAILKTDEHPVARNATEQMLGWIFSTQVGDMPPICPNLPFSEVADIEKILDLPADYQYDESLEKLEAKKTIEFAKKELKDYIAKGGTPQKFFEYYHGQLMQCYQEFSMARSEVLRVAREEDPGFACDYLREVNKRLADKGIKQIRLSPKMQERLGLTDNAKAKETEE